MCTRYPIINRVSELKVHIELTRFVQPEKIEIDANERAVNEKSQYCFFVCTTFDSFLNDLKRGNEKVAISNINTIISNDIQKVWNIVLAVDKYNSWRSDLSKTEIINDKQFIEYTKNGYATTFTVTVAEPYKRWEFDMENSNMKGHWIGVFIDKGNETQIDFTENVIPKKWFMKPFVKTYLKKQQKQFVLDLKKALE